jgi:NADH-quinone oxidoreductase subunit A
MTAMMLLSDAVNPGMPGGEAPSAWAPVVLLILIGVGFAVGNAFISILVGPRRTGVVKSSTYESGMVPFGDTHKRFNVRFYIVAMIFLVIDVEIVFLYPWATIFGRYASDPALRERSNWLLGEMIVFVLILFVAYVYAWGKGVFRWD